MKQDGMGKDTNAGNTCTATDNVTNAVVTSAGSGPGCFSVRVVGCSGSLAGPHAAGSSYLLQYELAPVTVPDNGGNDSAQVPAEKTRWNVLLDVGSGALGQLMRYLDPRDLDAVVVSHNDPDHVVDLAGLEVYRHWHPDGPFPVLPVWGAGDMAECLRGICGDKQDRTYAEVFSFHSLVAGQSFWVGPIKITPYPARHTREAYGVRCEVGEDNPHVIAYTGDTDTCPEIIDMADGAHILLSEAGFVSGRDHARGIHLTGDRAGKMATEAGVKHLVLTHLQPWSDPLEVWAQARTTWDGQLSLAQPGALYQV